MEIWVRSYQHRGELAFVFWEIMPSDGWLEKNGDALFGRASFRCDRWGGISFCGFFIDGVIFRKVKIVFAIICGIVVSFLLDAIGVFAMLIVLGGTWVC